MHFVLSSAGARIKFVCKSVVGAGPNITVELPLYAVLIRINSIFLTQILLSLTAGKYNNSANPIQCKNLSSFLFLLSEQMQLKCIRSTSGLFQPFQLVSLTISIYWKGNELKFMRIDVEWKLPQNGLNWISEFWQKEENIVQEL